tara:strand:+ start:4562 stop:4873 length:312 start_codon:yes stop_codon:yes gene_type:complete
MSWWNILKSDEMQDTFIELSKAVNIWAGINGYPMDDEDDFGSLANRVYNIKRAAFYNEPTDLYKEFSKIQDITEDAAAIRKPLWELFEMLESREKYNIEDIPE